MNRIDRDRPRLHHARLGVLFMLPALLVTPAGAQLTAPLGERAPISEGRLGPSLLQLMGDVRTCGGLSCAQTAAGEIVIPAMRSVEVTGGGAAAHGLDWRSGDWLTERRADVRYRNDQMSAWIGTVRSDSRTGVLESGVSTNTRLEYGARVSRSAVDVSVSAGSGATVTRSLGSSTAQTPLRTRFDSARSKLDTLAADSSGNGRVPWSSAEVRATWSLGRLSMSAIVGRAASPQAPSSVWGSVEAARQLGRTGGASVFLNAGTSPPAAIGGMFAGARRSINLGLSFNTAAFTGATGQAGETAAAAAPAFLVIPASVGQYRLRIRVAHAQRVELASDCTEWQPLAMRHLTGDDWEGVVSATVGPHSINIRIDGGAWIAPPGLVPINDDFAGSVGVFVVE